MTWNLINSLHWIDPVTLERRPLSAASGLIATARKLWVVGDDLHHLVRFDRQDASTGEGFKIFSGEIPEEFKVRKRAKPDTECLIRVPFTEDGVSMVAFPSGSRPQRCRAAEIQLSGSDEIVGSREVNILAAIQFLDKRIPDLNIEGGVVLGEEVIFLQRGNGKAGFNGVISFSVEHLKSILQGSFNPETFNPVISEIRLPQLDGVPLTFTDACSHNGEIYFSAAAESGSSTYEDGKILGSAIGRLRPNSEILTQIEGIKVEGLAVVEEARGLASFAVTDADDPSRPSQLLEVCI
jgi:hypothetical protein